MLTRKPTNRIRRLAARSTPLAIAPGRSKSVSVCGFIAQLVEHRTGIAEVTDFFQASSFQLLKLENSLRGSFFTFSVCHSPLIFQPNA